MFHFFFARFLRHAPSSTTAFNLEMLPNEILFDILSYLSVSDLIYGWLDLNSRFDAIVYSLPIREVYDESKRLWRRHWWFSWHYPTHAELLQYFAFQVVSLQIHQYATSFNVNRIDILQYPNLHRLIIRQATSSQVNAIRADSFPHLEYLTLAETKYVSFNILSQFKSLRSCELQSIEIDDQNSCFSPSIRSLVLHECDPSKLLYLLCHLPQLIYLKVNIFWTQTSVQPFAFEASFIHPNLRSLDISLLNLPCFDDSIGTNRCDIVSTLLAHLSPDQHVRCRLVLVGMTNFNFDQLQQALHKLNLCRFSCILVYMLRYHSLPDFDHIRQLSFFNQLQANHYNSDNIHTYHLIWTNVH